MTAAASGSNGITVADDNDIDFGTGDFFLHWEGSLPDWTPASTVVLAWKTAASVGYLPSITSAGILRLQINATAYSATVATGLVDGATAKIDIVVTRSSALTAGSVVFYVNGAQLGASVAIAAGAPATVSNAEPLYISGSPTARTASNTISCIVGNFAPTAAEVLDLCTNGIPESWKWGSQAILTSQASSDFEAGTVGSWTANASGATVVVNSTTPIAGTYDLSITSTGSTASGACVAVSIISGKLYSFRFSYKAASGAWTCSIRNTTGATSSVPATGIVQPTITADGSIRTAVYTFTATATQTAYFHVRKSSEASLNTLFLDNFISAKAGATMALLPNSIPTSGATAWDDSSGNTGGGTLPAAGASKVTIRK